MSACGFGYVEKFYSEEHKEEMLRIVFGNQSNPDKHEFFLPTWLEEILKENKELKEKLKFYLEPFELRPTYQELEKKLDYVIGLIENMQWDEEDIGSQLKKYLGSKK